MAPRGTARLALLAALLAACGRASIPAGPIALVDDAGDTVRLAQPARRIASLVPATTELLFALGAGPFVVGRTAWCDWPPEAAAVPSLGDGLSPNVEAIVAARPDLVVLYRSGRNAAAAERLRSVGVATIQLRTDSFDDLGRNAALLGLATGLADSARAVTARLRQGLSEVDRRGAGSGPRVLILAWDQPPMTIGRGSFLHELVEMAGGKNLFDDLEAASAPVSLEAIAARNPDLILTTAESPAFAERPEWQSIRAVRERRFLRVQGSEHLPKPQGARRHPAPLPRHRFARDALMRGGRLLLLSLGALAALGAGIMLGSVTMGPRAIARALQDPASTEAAILLTLRLPRVILAFVVGAALGLTGTALQALVRNPLADPYLLGLSGGAGLGAVLAIAIASAGAWTVPAAAWVGAIAAVALVYRLAVVAGRRLDPRILLLAGVVVSAFTGAVMSAVLTLVPAPDLRNAFLWLLGGFGAASWQALGIFGAYAVVPAALLVIRARDLDLLSLGEEPAQYLGADVERVKRMVYFSASLLTAAAVAVCGVIGFVGLVVPHAMRRVVGPMHRALIPAVTITSGGFLVLADALARTVARPLELPVGVVTAVVGVPLFALLLRRSLR